MHVTHDRHTGTQIQELAHPGRGQEPHRTAQERPIRPRRQRCRRILGDDLPGRLPISGKVVHPTQKVVVYPSYGRGLTSPVRCIRHQSNTPFICSPTRSAHDGSGITAGTLRVDQARAEIPKHYRSSIPITVVEEQAPVAVW